MTSPRIIIKRHEVGVYEWLIAYGNEKVAGEIGNTSITECLVDGADSLPEDVGLVEIEYRGVHMGTYPRVRVREFADDVADIIVESYGALAQHLA
jgi:hypothetical protein